MISLVSSPTLSVSTDETGVAKSITSIRRSRLSGKLAPLKSTRTRLPCWRISIDVLGSLRVTIMRPAPSGLRRKSMFSILAEALGRLTCVALPAKLAVWPAPSETPRRMTILLPETRVSYGTSASILRTTRVRPPASAVTTELSGPTPTLVRRRSIFRLVPGRSNAIRAGSVIVKLSGSGAAPLSCSSSCTCWPGKVTTLMSSSCMVLCAAAGRANRQTSAATIHLPA